MSQKIEAKNQLQTDALMAWWKAGGRNTVISVTGSGKSWIAIKAMRLVQQHLDRKITVLHLSETTVRKASFEKELSIYSNIYGGLFLESIDIDYTLYQSQHKYIDTYYDLVIDDEAHEAFTPKKIAFYRKNTYMFILCITATFDGTIKYIEHNCTKQQLLDSVAPICFTYGLKEAKENKVTADNDLYIIYNKLGDNDAYIASGSKHNTFYVTEFKRYDYLYKELKKCFGANAYKRNRINSKITELLFRCRSKRKLANKIVEFFKDSKCLMFGNSVAGLCQIVPTIHGKNKKEHAAILSKFDSGEISCIGSFKVFKQGVTLDNLDVIILKDYYSKKLDFIQRTGRLRDKGVIVIILTLHTLETKWCNTMMAGSGYTPIYCNDFEDFKTKYNVHTKIKQES